MRTGVKSTSNIGTLSSKLQTMANIATVKPKTTKPISSIPESDYVYYCEWENCEECLKDLSSFIKHISGHISEYAATLEPQATMYTCKWRECESQILGHLPDFNRHVYFHAFHVRLKFLGKAVLLSSGQSEFCSLDGQSRNWIPELPESLICGWNECEVVYDNPVYFYSHVNQHCDEYNEGNNLLGGAKCRWSGCETVVRNRYKLKEHVRSHSQEKVIACPTCGGLFANRTKFLDHQKRQLDLSKQLFQCSHCNKRFSTARILRDHMRHHVNHYKCPFCDMTCPSPSGLRSHIRYRHTEAKPYKCGHCDHSAKSATDLRRHIESHNDAAPYCCQEEGCHYEVRTYQALVAHNRKVHQNKPKKKLKYQCHVCVKKFSRGTFLTNHLKSEHKFKWPSGHSRFKYKLHEDGYWRLQTVRYESIEVSDDQYLSNEDTIDVSTFFITNTVQRGQVAMETEQPTKFSIQAHPHSEQIAMETRQESLQSQSVISVDSHHVTMDTQSPPCQQSQVVMATQPDTASRVHVNNQSDQERYNLDLLGEVAIQDSQDGVDSLRTINLSQYQQVATSPGVKPSAVYNDISLLPPDHGMTPLHPVTITPLQPVTMTTDHSITPLQPVAMATNHQSLVYNQSEPMLETMSTVGRLDMSLLYSSTS